MVVKMKKLELLLYYKEREQFIETLRTLGVVHVVENTEKSETPDIVTYQGLVRRGEQAVRSLVTIRNKNESSRSQIAQGDPLDLLNRFDTLLEQREKINQELLSLKKDLSVLTPWGDFDPQGLKKLSEKGVSVRFFVLQQKLFDALDKKSYVLQEINRIGGSVYFVSVGYGVLSQQIGAEEVTLPNSSIFSIKSKIKELEAQCDSLDISLDEMTGYIDLLEKFTVEKTNTLQYERTRESMSEQAKGSLLHLSGWVPLDCVAKLEEYFVKHPVYYSLRDPLPDDVVPVKLKNNAFAKLFEPVTGIYSLPQYSELDITPFMAPFFALFFGLCLGDVGYGLLLLTGSLIAYFKVNKKLKPIVSLVMILSGVTIVSGVLLNSFFGQPIFGGPGVEGAFLSSGVQMFSPLSSMVTENGQVFPAMGLAMVLGFLQVLFGLGLKSYISMKTDGFTSGIQPIASMLIIGGILVMAAHADFLNLGIPVFTVGPVLIGKMLLSVPLVVARAVLIIGVLLFLIFNNMDKKALFRPLLGLYELYNFATGLLSNILSYLRLFALGLAGGLLGASFNQIAFMFITAPDGKVNYASAGIIGTLFVLVVGHSLNLSLSLIGAFVHPLRLTFVEFYGAIGFKGGSKPYRPFTKIEHKQ